MNVELKRIHKIAVLILFPFFLAASCEEKPPVDYTSIEGFYSCNEGSASSGYRKYIVEIDKYKQADNTYVIFNFHNMGDNEFVHAEYVNDTLYINNDVIGTLFVEGKGSVSEDFKTIQLHYLTDDGVVVLDYFASYER